VRPSQVVRRAATYLERHGVEGPRASAEILLSEILGTDRAGLYTRAEGLSAAEARAFGRALCRRCAGVPLQHLTGRQLFRQLELTVRPGVFVPRPETEAVVEVALDAVSEVGEPIVVDVGTGAGAIALAAAQERPDATVYATDLSPPAVQLALENAARLGLPLEAYTGDLFAGLPAGLMGRVHCVVSNPPYVHLQDVATLPDDVRADPEVALVGGTDVHARLVEESPAWLAPGGSLVVEIGAEQGPAVHELFERRFTGVRVLSDLAGRDRVVAGRLP
jgi:release factor glutamine methyltransferase